MSNAEIRLTNKQCNPFSAGVDYNRETVLRNVLNIKTIYTDVVDVFQSWHTLAMRKNGLAMVKIYDLRFNDGILYIT